MRAHGPNWRSLRFWQILLALALRGALGGSVLAQGTSPLEDQRIFQMIHTAWTARDGAPQNINTLAQTSDGTLWLGTRDGLYTFDGITFSLFHPASGSFPRKNVQFLYAARDGSLWAYGGMIQPTRIRGGATTIFNRTDRGTLRWIDSIRQGSDGTLWAILNKRELVRLGTDGIWHLVPGPKPESDEMGPLFIDSLDTQWLVADEVLYRRPRGAKSFTSTNVRVYGGLEFAEGRDHSIWICSEGSVGEKPLRPPGQPPDMNLKHVDASGKRLPNAATRDDVSAVAVASDGSVWLSHVQGGLEKLQLWQISGAKPSDNAAPPDVFGVSDGLTTTGFRDLLRDRDGDIWAVGGRGLDRFQRASMVPVVKDAIGGWWTVCASPGGDIWLSVVDGYRAIVRGNQLIPLKRRENISSILCNEGSTVRLLIMDSGIGEIRNGRIESLPVLPAHGQYWEHYRFTSLVVLPDHRLLVATIGTTENRLWVYSNGTWRPFLPASRITRIRAMLMSRQSDLYLGSQDGRVFVLTAPGYEARLSQSLAIGAVEGFSKTSYGVFAYGENGIALERSNVFRMLTFSDPDLSTSVTGLVEDPGRNIWINGSRAIARIPSSEITAAISDPSHHIVGREFREGDYRGSDIFAYSRNSAQIDTQGRLWFSTANGVIYIDPHHIDRRLRPPTLSIRSITADGLPLPVTRAFPPRIDTLNVRYFGLNLSNPTGVVYRYKLLGSDTSWQEVGSRTEAVYTHLGPGKYLFQVEASNGDGLWTAPLNSATFRILPAFYQTWWFETFCIALAAFLLWLGFSLRVRWVSAAIRSRAEERAEERIRIARELHDTLLQGVQGLLLSFHAAASKVPTEHESKKALEKALASADRIILEGRDRVNRLRSEHLTNDELEPSIEAVADDLTGLSTIDFALERIGTRETLNPEIVDEIYYIVREALTNSFRHSRASRIVVALDYGKHQLSVTCRDDGRGFDSRELQESAVRGHWGLRGMAERAEKIGAEFDCQSAPGEGVQIRIVLPASRAYIRTFGLRALFNHRNGN